MVYTMTKTGKGDYKNVRAGKQTHTFWICYRNRNYKNIPESLTMTRWRSPGGIPVNLISHHRKGPGCRAHSYFASGITCLRNPRSCITMNEGHGPDVSAEIARHLDKSPLGPCLKADIMHCVAFHVSPAPGVLIGAVMVDYALELLGAERGDRVYAACETQKCLPDALQVVAHCTAGNNRLRIIPIGKFAITLNRSSSGSTAEGVRVYIDLKKLKKFPVIEAWYLNSPVFDKPTMKDRLQDEIFRAGREILSWEQVRVPVTGKRAWRSVACPSCWETVPDYLVVDGRCAGCGPLRYYEVLEDNRPKEQKTG